ncbi:anhydro-N-acetylmuramic acid kinase [Rhodovulum sp. ES.010]|uniref:anhydro-N-acetylmuramic acid kinase n=1 Tax=Rhodovulum sp. ES.010 TaxID=1882821 RepID=UPI000926E8D7|nr:anhydro-N-acetylmuramic acid kinase [Rhodovulum sp. ES.010]SIO24024.1 anhydro-N-acetylmuramic acid kinase [Rhodovulum sp. ES.010]
MLKPGPVRALGTMSGTSLDGVDAAVVVTDGEAIAGFGETAYRAYAEEERAVLGGALGRWPGEAGVAAADEIVELVHAEVMAGFASIDIAGFHGQTLAHEPRGRGTHQAGDGRVLAGVLGVPVVWDFRAMDVRLGGEGAPLAPFFHFACAKWIGAQAPLAFVNLGGVGNLTWVDPTRPRPEAAGALLAFDTGPANAPIDDLMRARGLGPCDRDGALAARGRVAEAVIGRLLQDAYFLKMPPKSLDRNAFARLSADVARLSDADAAATLTAAAAASVARGLEHCPRRPDRLLVTGGGRKNPVLMDILRLRTRLAVEPVEVVGLDGDMLEAQAFGYLAVRVARGLPTTCPASTGVRAAVGGGTVSAPAPSARSVPD